MHAASGLRRLFFSLKLQIQYRIDTTFEGWRHAFERDTGFSDSVIIQWLAHNNLYQSRVCAFTRVTSNIYNTLNSLANQHGCDAFLCRNHRHAFAIKKFRGTWKLLDSLKNRAVDLHPSSILQPFTVFKLGIADENAREDIRYPYSPYMEKQEKAFCLVHSFNMALGEPIISGNEVLSHIGKMNETLIQRNLQRISLNYFYSPGIGNFNIMILNHYPSKIPWNQDRRYILQYYNHRDLPAAYKDAVILATTRDLGTLQGHAVTLKRHGSRDNANDWFLLDSHNNRPKQLLISSDWSNLQGSITFLQQGSVWVGLHPQSDLHLADSSFPYNPDIHMQAQHIINIETTPETMDAQPSALPLLPNCSTQPMEEDRTMPQKCYHLVVPTQPIPQFSQNCHNNDTQLNPPKHLGKLKIMAMNVRGLRHNYWDIRHTTATMNPDVVVLTETKLTNTSKHPPWIYSCLKNYKWWPAFDKTGGTIICARETIALATRCSAALLNSKGRIASVTLQGTMEIFY
eukprot:1142878-Pelagomonas_calceolata.AAC.1